MKTSTPKNFILQLGALIALYISVTSLLILIFNVINLKFPDEAAYYWVDESARETVRNSIAMLVVFFPAFLTFTRLSNQDRRKFTQGAYATFPKWLVYISILGGILILLGDLVTLIIYFLNGEITTRFIMKVVALLLVVGVTLHYYILDVKGYFKKAAKKALYFALGVTVLVISSLLFGYSYIETPSEVREMRLDEQQVTDLQDIYWHVDEYYHLHASLPETIADAYPQTKAPSTPKERDAYQFKIINETTLELCATFAFPSKNNDHSAVKPLPKPIVDETLFYQNQNWEHKSGEVCFSRIIPKDISPVSTTHE